MLSAFVLSQILLHDGNRASAEKVGRLEGRKELRFPMMGSCGRGKVQKLSEL